MATTFFQSIIQLRNRVKEHCVRELDDAVDFVSGWVCCSALDEDYVIENVNEIVRINDTMAIEHVEFNHSPNNRHYSLFPDDVLILNNERRVTSSPEPVTTPLDGHQECDNLEITPVVNTISVLADGEEIETQVMGDLFWEAPDANNEALIETKEVPGGASVFSNAPSVESVLGDTKPSLVYTICQDVVEVKNHRRVSKHSKRSYESCVVSEIKNKMGLPKPTEANRLVVRRMAHNIMTKHGVRPTHIRLSIERVIAGVFVPDAEDLVAAEMLASNRMADLRQQVENAGPKTKWMQLYEKFRFGSRRIPTPRVVVEAP